MVNCIIMSQIALQKDCFATIKVQARVRAHVISMWSFLLLSSKLLIFLQPNLVWWYSIISQSVWWKDWTAVFKFKGIVMGENFIQCFLSVHIFSTTDAFAAKLGVQMYYY